MASVKKKKINTYDKLEHNLQVPKFGYSYKYTFFLKIVISSESFRIAKSKTLYEQQLFLFKSRSRLRPKSSGFFDFGTATLVFTVSVQCTSSSTDMQ